VIVKTAAPLRLFRHAFGTRCELIALECDAGMVQIDSLNVDAGASVRRAAAFQRHLPALAVEEAGYLRDIGARLVVADIPPLAAAAAHNAGIPSVMIGNFTWDWIYESYREQGAADLAHDIRSMYSGATLALRLPMAGGFQGLEPVTRDIPFIARRSHRTRDDVRGALGLPPRRDGKPLVLLSFGGYGVARLDMTALSRLTNYTIATTDLTVRDSRAAQVNGLLYLSEQRVRDAGLLYEDLVRGADAVVTKPGYGIISEAIANGAALLYTSRGEFIEYEVLVREMPRYLRARFIEQKELLNGNWDVALANLLAQPPPPETAALNGGEVAAGEILQLAM
jgi:L-arabinokinase